MAFTTTTITHMFKKPDGSAATGSIAFQLSKRMTNSGVTIVPGEVVATLGAGGALSQALTSNNDTGTIPGDATWVVTFRIDGDSVVQYSITVPTGGGTVDLGSLLPQQVIGG